MTFDGKKNLVYGTVLAPPVPAATGVAMTVRLAPGVELPAAPWDAIVWAEKAQPLPANSEFVRVTKFSLVGNTLTIEAMERIKQNSAARSIEPGDQFAQPVSAKAFLELEEGIEAETTARIAGEATKATSAALTTEKTARETAEALLTPLAQKGAASGVATLDSESHVPVAQMSPSVVSGRQLEGEALPGQPTVNFQGQGIYGADDPTNKRTDWRVLNEVAWSHDPRFAGGTVGNGVADDTAALNAFFAAVGAVSREKGRGAIKGGEYKTTAELIAESANQVNIEAAGPTDGTVILPAAASYNGLFFKAANGSSISGLRIVGPTSAPSSGKAAFMNATKLARISRVYVEKNDVGFGFQGNCFGSNYDQCAVAQNTCNVGINCQTGTGNDVNFYDCWVHGQTAGVSVSPNNGNMHFWGGQIGTGENLTEEFPERGAVILGKDYLTGAAGSYGGIHFHNVDFEGSLYVWLFRMFGEGELSVLGGLLSGNGVHPLIGILKAHGVYRALFAGVNIAGAFSAPKVVDNSEASGVLTELNTYGSHCKVNTAVAEEEWTPYEESMAIQSKLPNAVGFYKNRAFFGGVILRNNAKVVEQSTDYGTTWAPLTTGLATKAEVETAAAGGLPLLLPIQAAGNPVPLTTSAPGTAFKAWLMRTKVPRKGKIKSLYVWNGATVAGKCRAAIFDIGATSSGKMTVLWEGAEVENAGENKWQLVGTPELAVELGQELMLAIMTNSATMTLGKTAAEAGSLAAILPENFLPGPGYTTAPPVIGTHTYAELKYGTITGALGESNIPFLIVGRIE